MTTKVYQAINKVQAALSKAGITKANRNAQQGYNFRGIDDVYNALSPLLAEHGLCILPRMLSRSCEERQTAKGGTLFYTTVEAEFDFVCAEDGSKHTVKTYGEAMDSGDKSTNKAMSAAYKYAAMQSFAIPTEGDNDADAQTHEVVARPRPDIEAIKKALSNSMDMRVLKRHVQAAWHMLEPGPDRDRVKDVYDQRKSELAATEKWKDKQTGQSKEHTEWIKASFVSGLADVAEKYLRNGSQVYVEGSLRTHKWTSKDGVERYSTEIRADKLLLLGSAKERNDAPRSHEFESNKSGFDDMDSDIPY